MCSRENWQNLQSSTKVENCNHLGTWVGLSAAFNLVFILIPCPSHLSFLFRANSELLCGSEGQIGLLLNDFTFFMLNSQLCLISAFCVLWSSQDHFHFPKPCWYLLTAIVLFSLFVLTDSHLNSFIIILLVLEEEVEINAWFQCAMFNQKFYTKL